ncbi:MAG: MFS transporter [Alicyclobacillaceae bacterium]|nr:MFS transporter [Alicyclobacillaceae bacterium]
MIRQVAFFTSLFSMFVFGAIDMTRGVSGPLMQQGWHLSYLQLGYLFTANSTGYLFGSFVAGTVMARLGMASILRLGAFLSGIGLTGVLLSPGYAVALACFLLSGFGNGWLEIGVNAVVPAISSGPADSSRKFNTLHGFYGVGCVVFPTVAAVLANRTGTWHTGFAVTAGFMFTLLVIVLLIRYRRLTPSADAHPAVVESAHTSTKAKRSLWTNPLFYGFAVALMMYVMIESGIASWLPTFMVHVHGMSVRNGSLYLTGFYFLFTLGRLSGRLWVPRVGEYRAIFISGLVLFMVLAVAVIDPSLYVLFIVAGVGCAVIFPTVVSIASHAFPKNVGAVLGVLFTGAGIGSMLVNSLIGVLATHYGLAKAFWIFPVLVLVVLASLVVTQILLQRQHSATRADLGLEIPS